MRWFWLVLASMSLLALSAGARSSPTAPIPAAKARAGQFVDLTPLFVQNIEAGASRPDAERLKAFHDQFDPLVPGYFNGKSDQAAFDANLLSHMAAFPAEKAKFLSTAAAFRAAFARGETGFRRAFTDYRLTTPVYLVHSMGMQDGGTRSIAGRTVLFFGADVIARIHDAETMGPFLNHELFHVYHGRFFEDCDAVWCQLWSEGLAVYVASRLTPAASDRALLLTQPSPLRPAVMPRLGEAMCRLGGKLDSTDAADYAEFFTGGPQKGAFPRRYGYLLGLLVVEKIGQGRSLSQLAKMPAAQVKPLVERAVASFGPCPAGSSAP